MGLVVNLFCIVVPTLWNGLLAQAHRSWLGRGLAGMDQVGDLAPVLNVEAAEVTGHVERRATTRTALALLPARNRAPINGALAAEHDPAFGLTTTLLGRFLPDLPAAFHRILRIGSLTMDNGRLTNPTYHLSSMVCGLSSVNKKRPLIARNDEQAFTTCSGSRASISPQSYCTKLVCQDMPSETMTRVMFRGNSHVCAFG